MERWRPIIYVLVLFICANVKREVEFRLRIDQLLNGGEAVLGKADRREDISSGKDNQKKMCSNVPTSRPQMAQCMVLLEI